MRKMVAIISAVIVATTVGAPMANAKPRPVKPHVSYVHERLASYPFPFGSKDTLAWVVYRVHHQASQ